jgi:hypothetical protein
MVFHDVPEVPVSSADPRELDLLLKRDPAGAYEGMDAATHERYRQVCRELASWSGKAPSTIAHEAVQLCLEQDASDPRGRHVGTHLLAEGRPLLEKRLGCHVPWRARALRLVHRHAAGSYIGALLALLALALLGVERLLASRGLALPYRGLLTASLTLPLLDFLQETVHWGLLRLAGPPVPLPRLEPGRIFSPDTRTMVVTPLLITGAEDLRSQLRRMGSNALGNTDPELFFALLTDFRDAQAKELPGEAELLEQLKQGIRQLNEQQGYREQPRFFFLHRERRWNPVAGRWMGWERKRGKLEEFNRLVLGARDTSYTGSVPEIVRTIRYVITLDADTHLLPGSAARLVATLHHPLNRPRFDAAGQRVIAGYSILQPNSEFSPTRARWLASGGWPVSLVRQRKDAVSANAWMLQQRLFGTGAFVGKGLYDVAAFARCLEGQFPENAILSHDKLEGMYARAGLVHDIKLFESQPEDMTVFARIWHRWLRGDWQLLPWLFPRVPGHGGRSVPNPLSLLDRWQLLMGLARSLSYPASLWALACGWLWLPGGGAWAWTLGATLWICRHSLAANVVNMVRAARRSKSVMAGVRSVFSSMGRLILGTIVRMAAILPSSALVLDAVIRVLYRLAFDRSRMLDWQTHAQASRQVRGFSLLARPEAWGALVLALVLAGALAVFNPGALPWACPLLVVWLPVLVHTHRRRAARRARKGALQELDSLRSLARGCWARYASWDPTREQPPRALEAQGEQAGVSPTDLGLWLVAPVSAYHLGYLEPAELVSRLGGALAVIAELERYRGHFFDQYDLRERRRVGPRHISTAESGAVAAAFVVAESGLHAARAAASSPELIARLEAVEALARRLREEMDFAFLYDGAVELLYTGYDAGSGVPEGAHHGLLTSAAMLAGFMAIALRQVPLQHWLALGASDQRQRAAGARAPGERALAEQLLPTLFLWFPPATLLGRAALSTVDAGLGTRGAGPAPPAIAPPHLSVLALRFRPEQALANLRHVAGQELPAAAEEAAGPPALSIRKHALVLAAVANLACDDILIQHFHQHWQTAWVEALIYETEDAP